MRPLGDREGGVAPSRCEWLPNSPGGRPPPPPTVAIDITEEARGGGPPYLQHLLIALGNSAGSRCGGARPFGIIIFFFSARHVFAE